MNLSRIKNWADNTSLWGVLVLVAIIVGATVSGDRETKAHVIIAGKILKGERVKVREALRVRSLAGTITFESALRKAGIPEVDIRRLRGDELTYIQLPPSKR